MVVDHGDDGSAVSASASRKTSSSDFNGDFMGISLVDFFSGGLIFFSGGLIGI